MCEKYNELDFFKMINEHCIFCTYAKICYGVYNPYEQDLHEFKDNKNGTERDNN